MKTLYGTLAILIAMSSNSPTFAFSAIGLRTALVNCLNKNLASPERIEACNVVIHTNVLLPRDRARVITSRGNAYFASANLDNALNDYNKAVSLNSQLAEAVTNRAVALTRLGKCDQATSDFSAMLASDARSWRALYGRSLCETKSGDQPKAQTDLAAAVAINPNASREFGPVEIAPWFQ